jgi:hypothetical protein
LLTQLNANPNNEPLRESAVTLSKTTLIEFQPSCALVNLS